MNLTLTKEFNWAMCHMLENHKGLCKNIHGHGYKMFVTIKQIKDNNIDESSKGMICDFKDLKKMVNIAIIDRVDHAFMYNKHDKVSKKIADYLDKHINQKLLPVSFRTTAENMSQWISEELNEYFITFNFSIRCVKVVLYETDTSFATYEVE